MVKKTIKIDQKEYYEYFSNFYVVKHFIRQYIKMKLMKAPFASRNKRGKQNCEYFEVHAEK